MTRAAKKTSKRKRARSKRTKPVPLTPFLRSYLTTALWSTNDESTPAGGEPLDKRFSPEKVSMRARAKAAADCDAFRRENARDLEGLDEGQVAHDFWLTRNRHGAGFWDGDYEKEVGKRLTDSAHKFGEVNLYVNRGRVDGHE